MMHGMMHDHFDHHHRMPSLEEIKKFKLQMMVAIVDRSVSHTVTEILFRHHVHFQYSCMAYGTASSDILDLLGLGSTDKSMVLSLAPVKKMPELMKEVSRELSLSKAGKGIAFSLPLSGVSMPVLRFMSQDTRDKLDNVIEKEVERVNTSASHDLILAVVNQGCSEDVMSAAKTAGATGGTVLHSRRMGTEEATKFFGISLQAEKEIVAILTSRESKQEIMKAIGQRCGFRSEANGIVLSLPVDSVAGIEG